jgi:serine protease Do
MNFSTLLNTALDDLLAKVRPVLAVVHNGRHGAGAGVLVGEGLVLTSHHVVARGRSFKVILNDGASYEARVLSRNPETDLALLSIPANGHPLAVFSAQEPRPGELVFAFGHPWGERAVLTGGVLSAASMARTRNGEIPVLRTDARLAPGNSGGPLLNAAGEVIGLNAMIFGGDQGIAIAASVIREFLGMARSRVPANAVPEGVF